MSVELKILFLFSDSYPARGKYFEYVFLKREVIELAKHFDKIYVFPRIISRKNLDLPENVVKDTLFSKFFASRLKRISYMLLAFFYPGFWKELYKQKQAGIKGAVKILLWMATARHIRKTLKRYQELILNNDLTFYSYWCHDTALGLIRSRKEFKGVKVISRAHGFDIYNKSYKPYFHPFRQEVLNSLDLLVVISNDGKKYLNDEYPDSKVKVEVHHLGVESKGRVQPSDDLVIVSCSSVDYIKRVSLIWTGITQYAELNPGTIIRWVHIGGGPDLPSLKKDIAASKIPSNFTIELKGHLPNDQVIELYIRENPKFFINVSSTEGIPVSMMEAFSCGIPVLATEVGGVHEIVNNSNGCLLTSNPSEGEIIAGIEKLNQMDWEKLSQNAFESWKENWDAKENYENFAKKIKSLKRRH